MLACARAPLKSEALAELATDAALRITVHALDVSDHAAIDALAIQLAGTPIDVQTSVAGMIRVIAGLTRAQSGKFLTYAGEALPW